MLLSPLIRERALVGAPPVSVHATGVTSVPSTRQNSTRGLNGPSAGAGKASEIQLSVMNAAPISLPQDLDVGGTGFHAQDMIKNLGSLTLRPLLLLLQTTFAGTR